MNSDPLHITVTAPLELFQLMFEAITDDGELEPLLTWCIERACKLTGADGGVIGLYVAERDVIRTAANFNAPVDQLQAELGRGEGLMGRVLEQDSPVRCRYSELPNQTRKAPRDQNVIGMPIRTNGKLIGVFGIGRWAPDPLDDEAFCLLELFSRHAAVAIFNATRYREEKRRSARFAMIAKVSGIIASERELYSLLQRAADAMHELLGFSAIDIPIIESEAANVLMLRISGGEFKRSSDEVTTIAIGAGIIGEVARQRRPLLVNDCASDYRYAVLGGVRPHRAELAVPILYGRELVGVLNVESDEAFDDLDITSLEIVAEHLAVAIHNCRLLESSNRLVLLEERQRLARELHDNVTQILSSINLICRSLVPAWERDPVDGARRATRLGELAQMAFSEMRELLRGLAPLEPSDYRNTYGQRLTPLATMVAQLRQSTISNVIEQVVTMMVPTQLQVRVDFSEYRNPQMLEAEEALLRICQEAVSNVVRHAEASEIMLRGSVTDTFVLLEIEDNGRGLPQNHPKGMGQRNMKQRIEALGGTVQFLANHPKGTLVAARLPRRDRVA
jgi:signal transduction histidine kinase